MSEIAEVLDAAKGLARWTHHHSTCARTIEAGTCDCGLNDAWQQIQRWEIDTDEDDGLTPISTDFDKGRR